MITDSDLAYFLQQGLNAGPRAALYALLAFGYALSFGLTRRADFTPGALFAFAGQLFVLFTAFGYDHFRLVYVAALSFGALVALSSTLLAAAATGRHVTRRLARRGPHGLIVASLGLMVVLTELVRIAADTRELWLSPFLNARLTLWPLDAYPVVITQIQLVNMGLMAIAVLSGAVVLARSRAGRAWRAVADDPQAAELMGIDSARVLVMAGLATALCASLAGILATAYFGSMDFGSGLMFGLKVVLISAIGDQLSPPRSAFGAAAFGIVETFWGAYVGFAWREPAMVSLLVLLAVLLRQKSSQV